MIVPMKRITVVGLGSEQDELLHQLRSLGIVHVHHLKPPEGGRLDSVREELQRAEAALRLLPMAAESADKSDNTEGADATTMVRQVWSLGEQLKTTREELAHLEKEALKVEILGDFRPEDVARLAEKGIDLKLYELPLPSLAEIPKEVIYSVVAEPEGKVIIAVLEQGAKRFLPFTPVPIPERSIGQIRTAFIQKKSEICDLEKQIAAFAPYRPQIEMHRLETANKLEFERIRFGMGDHQSLVSLRGYCPADDLARLKKTAHDHAWALMIEDPSPDDEPPTLIRNPFLIRIIQPVFRIIGTVPGYREFDIDLWFLIFFGIFFAILVGDAGYGTLFLAATAVAQIKLKNKIKQKEPFVLMYLLASATMIWGGMCGVWFGQEWISKVFPFSNFVVPSLYGFSDVSQNTVIRLCFALAVIHLTLAHTVAAIRVFPSLMVLAQAGWISFMWGVYFLARYLVLGSPLPDITRCLLIAGVVLVFLFANPQKTVWATLKTALAGSLNTALGFVSAFADTISYIRLFAVGLTGLAISQSFQAIALQVGFNNVIAGFGAALILVAAHALNIALGLMSVLVHGLRLNMLEFSGHLGIQWSGHEYKPFRKIEQN